MEAKRRGGRVAMAREHFGAAELGDARRTKRLVKTAQLIFAHPHGTLPAKLPDWADLNGLYRLAACPRVTHEAVTRPHRQRTIELMRACDPRQVVLIIHDATELDYTHVGELHDELGQIGNGGGRGYVCHNSLAVTVGDGAVLGLAAQVLHRRRTVSKRETPQQKRDHPARESRLWRRGCAAIGAAPDGRLWVDVCDRGADTFEFLEYEHTHGRSYVMRSARATATSRATTTSARTAFIRRYTPTRVTCLTWANGPSRCRPCRARRASGASRRCGWRPARSRSRCRTSRAGSARWRRSTRGSFT